MEVQQGAPGSWKAFPTPHNRGAAGRPRELGGIPEVSQYKSSRPPRGAERHSRHLAIEVQQAAPGSWEAFPIRHSRGSAGRPGELGGIPEVSQYRRSRLPRVAGRHSRALTVEVQQAASGFPRRALVKYFCAFRAITSVKFFAIILLLSLMFVFKVSKWGNDDGGKNSRQPFASLELVKSTRAGGQGMFWW